MRQSGRVFATTVHEKIFKPGPEDGVLAVQILGFAAVYLFSSPHLERPYTAFLAERADTGLLLNP